MSLKSSGEPPLDRGEYIQFVMLDGIKRVLCRISEEAIDDVEGGNPLANERVERFNRHRGRIEQIAIMNYDAGEAAPCVTSLQLCGPREA